MSNLNAICVPLSRAQFSSQRGSNVEGNRADLFRGVEGVVSPEGYYIQRVVSPEGYYIQVTTPSGTAARPFCNLRYYFTWQDDGDAVVGKLLEGVAAVIGLGDSPRVVRVNNQLAHWTGVIHALNLLTEVKLPEKPENYAKELRNVLINKEMVDPETLAKWFGLVIQEGLSPEKGVSPDSPALAIFKRILQLDYSRALKIANMVFEPGLKPHFVPGRFQLSLIGALTAQTHSLQDRQEIKEWAYEKIQFLIANQNVNLGESQTRFSVMASLVVLAFLLETDDEDGTTRLESVIGQIMDEVENPKQERFFLQFISDGLGQFITKADMPKHSYKALTLCKFLREDSILWPKRGLMALLKPLMTRVPEAV